MLSGSGRTMLNLLAASARREIPAKIALVIASKESLGATRAREAGLTTLILPGVIDAAALGQVLREHQIDAVALAGYLKLIRVPPGFEDRIVNIHPALLPAFGGPGMYGDHVHEAVLRAGVHESGCTVHLVDDKYDHGTPLLQCRCPVLPGDTPETLAARVFEQECIAYPAALRQLLTQLGHA